MSAAFRLPPWLRSLLRGPQKKPEDSPTAKALSHPRAYRAARSHIGTREVPGTVHNTKILGWFTDVGHSWVTTDETAWCAAFAGAMLEEGGYPSTRMLNARSYLDWGEPVETAKAREGDIVVFWRVSPVSWQGHVGFFVKRQGDHILVLGGNQGNEVNERLYPVNRLLGVRRYKAGTRT